MLTEIEVFAPAKVNLGLRVLPRPLNCAYHQIESIFQTVNLKDRLLVSITEGYDSVKITAGDFDLPEENTITTAYRAFKKVSGMEKLPSLNVRLEKHIPSGGGLGGGSSDAAFFVRALEKLFDVKLTEAQCDQIASETGSDVFFFFRCDENGDGCALVSGRGEIVEKIPVREDLHFLLVLPGIHSSTKEAYSLVDDFYSAEKFTDGEKGGNDSSSVALKKNDFPPLKVLETIYRSPLKCWSFVNSFTTPLTRRYPVIGQALTALKESGALFSDMSGSGSTVFGVFDSPKAAKIAADILCSKGFQTVLAERQP